jgi:hypothetical protein
MDFEIIETDLFVDATMFRIFHLSHELSYYGRARQRPKESIPKHGIPQSSNCIAKKTLLRFENSRKNIIYKNDTHSRQAAYINSALKYVFFENINKFSEKSMKNDQTFIATFQI